MSHREVMQQALEALKNNAGEARIEGAINILEAALAEQPAEQEPVAWCDQYEGHIDGLRHYSDGGSREIPLYAAPQPRRRLTDEEILELAWGECQDMRWPSTALHIARAIEAAVWGEKT